MSPELLRAIAAELDLDPNAIRVHQLGGGFASTARLERGDGSWFVKYLDGAEEASDDRFVAEAAGLRALASGDDPPVVEVYAASASPPYLLLRWVEVGARRPETMRTFGRELAQVHRRSADVPSERGAGRRFGFEMPNRLGATPQDNRWASDWVDFFAERRLGAQLEMLRRGGELDPGFERRCRRLVERLGDWIAEPEEPPCVLHGDLWSGNVLVGRDGRALMIDQATYYGRREADLAMPRIFGGFDGDFWRGYEEVWPLEPGADERMRIYELYHYLNHWNLFGSSYRRSCEAIVDRFV